MSPTELKQETLLARFWPLLLIGTVWAWMFGPMMTGQTVVGFRDSAYLYYPLFQWIDAQWAAGEIPLWNPYCNFGMPVVADGSSSVFYPGKLIFFCWFLSYPARYGIFLAIHIPIAALGTYCFAKTLRANRAGATLAAFSYAFGGTVLFQVTNVIFLVSAAWLPFALCCVWKMIKTGQLKWSVAAGVCCALMILGGDPQMVYHVGLIAVVTTVGEFVRRRRRRLRAKRTADSGLGNRRPYRWLFKATLRIAVMVVVTTFLAAVQLLPTFFWAKHSERMKPAHPANIYQGIIAHQKVGLEYPRAVEVFGAAPQASSYWESSVAIGEFLIGPPEGTLEHSYQFSQPPWSITELFWPNISGKPFPRHQRWTNSLPGAERVWVPSLYCGVMVALLALLGSRLWGRKRKQVWLTRLFLFFAIASFGWYGVIWLINEVAPNINQLKGVGPQVGGIYWAMNMVLPKYFAFRYPAKLFVVAALALSLLAGLNLRTTRLSQSWFAPKVLGSFLAITTVAILGLAFYLRNWLPNLASDSWFGRFDAAGAELSLFVALVQPMLVVLLTVGGGALLFRNQRRARLALLLIVAISILDVVAANHWMLSQVPTSDFEYKTKVSLQLKEAQGSQIEPIRIFRKRTPGLEPTHWAQSSSDNRLSDVVRWKRESLYPKCHLGENVVLVGSFSSVWPAAYEKLASSLDWAERGQALNENQSSHVSKNIEYNHVTKKLFDKSVGAGSGLRIVSAGSNENNFDVLGLVERSFVLKRTDEQARMGTCNVTEFTTNRVMVHSSSELPCTLHYFVFADAGWQATVKDLSNGESRDATLLPREDQLGFEMNLEAGGYEIEFKYSPIEFWIGAWVSGICWGAVAIFFVVSFRRKL
ncbi:MAG: hypothetical protein AB8B55_11135 [Mariniblastus sp.]